MSESVIINVADIPSGAILEFRSNPERGDDVRILDTMGQERWIPIVGNMDIGRAIVVSSRPNAEWLYEWMGEHQIPYSVWD